MFTRGEQKLLHKTQIMLLSNLSRMLTTLLKVKKIMSKENYEKVHPKVIKLTNTTAGMSEIQKAMIKNFEEIKAKQDEFYAKRHGDDKNPWIVGGRQLREVRSKMGLERKPFAKLLNISASTLSTWETGQFRPRFRTLIGIIYQLKDLGKAIGLPELGDLIEVEDFGYTKTGTSIDD